MMVSQQSHDPRRTSPAVDTQFEPEKSEYDKKLIDVATWMLRDGHINVVNPTEMLQDFPDKAYTLNNDSEIELRRLFLDQLSGVQEDQRHRAAKNDTTTTSPTLTHASDISQTQDVEQRHEDGMEEVAMYPQLVSAFNVVGFPADSDEHRPLRCFNIGSKSTGIKMFPDLALTFDYASSDVLGHEKVFAHPAVYVGVKSSLAFDLPLQRKDNQGKLIRGDLCKCQKQLLLQVLRYVHLGQALELLWDYIYFITVTGPVARIWKFTRSKCFVTTRINYLSEPDNLILFVRALSTNGRRGLGLCIGPDRPFTVPDLTGDIKTAHEHTRKLQEKLEKVAKVYLDYFKHAAWDSERRLTGIWILNVGIENHFPFIDESERLAPVDYLVFQHPLHRSVDMFSHDTRFYLAIAKSELDNRSVEKLTDTLILDKIRLLKTSWSKLDRIPEADLLRTYEERRRARKVDKRFPRGIPTLLASGSAVARHNSRTQNQPTVNDSSSSRLTPANENHMEESADTINMAEVEEYECVSHLVEGLDFELRKNGYSDIDSEHYGIIDRNDIRPADCRLDWLLFKEAGKDFSCSINSYEFTSAMRDALEAHSSLYEVGRVLHRDISRGNSIIAHSTSGRHGLLVDWELGKDNESETRRVTTGTIKYMSLALVHRPLHQAWHDLESCFWVLIYMVIRHAEGVMLDHEALTPFERRRWLNQYFVNQDRTDIETISLMKRGLLPISLTIPRGEQLETGTLLLRRCLRNLDTLFTELDYIDVGLTENGHNFSNAIHAYKSLVLEASAAHYSVPNKESLKKVLQHRIELVEELGSTLVYEAATYTDLMQQIQNVGGKLEKCIFWDYDQVVSRFKATVIAGERVLWLPVEQVTRGNSLDGSRSVSRTTSVNALRSSIRIPTPSDPLNSLPDPVQPTNLVEASGNDKPTRRSSRLKRAASDLQVSDKNDDGSAGSSSAGVKRQKRQN